MKKLPLNYYINWDSSNTDICIWNVWLLTFKCKFWSKLKGSASDMGVSVDGLSACSWAWHEWKHVWSAPQYLSLSRLHFTGSIEGPSISTTFQRSLDQQRPFHPINAGWCQIIIKISTESCLKKELIRHIKKKKKSFFFSCFETQIKSTLLTFKSQGLYVHLLRSGKKKKKMFYFIFYLFYFFSQIKLQ